MHRYTMYACINVCAIKKSFLGDSGNFISAHPSHSRRPTWPGNQ